MSAAIRSVSGLERLGRREPVWRRRFGWRDRVVGWAGLGWAGLRWAGFLLHDFHENIKSVASERGIRSVSAWSVLVGGLPPSRNQSTPSAPLRASQVPRILPPATTTGAIQPAVRLTADRRATSRTWMSRVVGPRTHWSNPGSSRTAAVGTVAHNSSRCSAKHELPLPVHVDADDEIVEGSEPGSQLLAREVAAGQPRAEGFGRRRSIGTQVRGDRPWRGFIRWRQSCPSGRRLVGAHERQPVSHGSGRMPVGRAKRPA